MADKNLIALNICLALFFSMFKVLANSDIKLPAHLH